MLKQLAGQSLNQHAQSDAVQRQQQHTFISFCVCSSLNARPIIRLVAYTVLVGLVTACTTHTQQQPAINQAVNHAIKRATSSIKQLIPHTHTRSAGA
jgi:hypothetical protein